MTIRLLLSDWHLNLYWIVQSGSKNFVRHLVLRLLAIVFPLNDVMGEILGKRIRAVRGIEP